MSGRLLYARAKGRGMKRYLDVVIVRERLSDGSDVFVAHCRFLGISSQGRTVEEAKENIAEAVEAFLEECPEKLEGLSDAPPIFSFVEVEHGKVAGSVR